VFSLSTLELLHLFSQYRGLVSGSVVHRRATNTAMSTEIAPMDGIYRPRLFRVKNQCFIRKRLPNSWIS